LLLRSAEANPLFYRFVSKYDFVILRDYLLGVTGGLEWPLDLKELARSAGLLMGLDRGTRGLVLAVTGLVRSRLQL
jgi:hypothetical protein